MFYTDSQINYAFVISVFFFSRQAFLRYLLLFKTKAFHVFRGISHGLSLVVLPLNKILPGIFFTYDPTLSHFIPVHIVTPSLSNIIARSLNRSLP
jgi:hypothetical protein